MGAVRSFQRQRNRLRHLQQRAFDRRWGVDTAGLVSPAEMAVDGPSLAQANLYEATWSGSVIRMIRSLDLDLPAVSFVDVGSGKGPVLLYASRFPFRRVIGVEHSRALHEIAQANIVGFPRSRMRCGEVTSVWADALDYELPDGPLVLFLCNPFQAASMSRFFDRLRRDLRADPRDVTVISFNPAVEDVIERLPWLVRRGRGWSHATYRVDLTCL